MLPLEMSRRRLSVKSFAFLKSFAHEALSQYPGTARYFGFSRKIFNPGISLIPGTIAR